MSKQVVRRVGVHEAKTHLSRLLKEVEKGREVIIERGGVAVARLSPMFAAAERKSSYGLFAGQYKISSDFDADSDSLADDFGIPR
jgi:antitoxin (DNA-binding transcriptional repressor) of toxin-antitoxin stability system